MQQASMFGTSHVVPEGFTYSENLITPDEEQDLISHFSQLPLVPYVHEGYEAKRRVQHFGVDHDVGTDTLIETTPIPSYLEPLREKAAAFAKVLPTQLVHALVTEYVPGTPIGWHRDMPPFDRIVGVSFAAPCTFRMRLAVGEEHSENKKNTWQRYSQTVQPRSIYIMEGPARYKWQHSIPPLEELRYSVTFRTIQ